MYCRRKDFLKHALFYINLVCAIGCVVLFALGVPVQLELRDLRGVLPGVLGATPVHLIVVSSLTFFISFMGFVPTTVTNVIAAGGFAIIRTIMIAYKTYILATIFVNLSNMTQRISDWLSLTFEDAEPFNRIETVFECCGTTGPESYLTALPDSCCPDQQGCTLVNSYAGCQGIVTDYFDYNSIIIGIALAVVVALEALIIILAIVTTVKLKRAVAETPAEPTMQAFEPTVVE